MSFEAAAGIAAEYRTKCDLSGVRQFALGQKAGESSYVGNAIDGVASWADNVRASLGIEACAYLQGSSKLAGLFLHHHTNANANAPLLERKKATHFRWPS
jgi:hypothetical protein